MSSTTTNIGLTKPAMTDTWGNIIPGIASSMDTIDNRLGILSNSTFTYVENFPIIAPEADDTARIKRSFSSIPNGGLVMFGAKSYTVSDTLNPTATALDYMILGAGRQFTKINQTANKPIFYFSGAANLDNTFSIEKMYLSSTVASSLIRVDNVLFWTLRDLHLKNPDRTAIELHNNGGYWQEGIAIDNVLSDSTHYFIDIPEAGNTQSFAYASITNVFLINTPPTQPQIGIHGNPNASFYNSVIKMKGTGKLIQANGTDFRNCDITLQTESTSTEVVEMGRSDEELTGKIFVANSADYYTDQQNGYGLSNSRKRFLMDNISDVSYSSTSFPYPESYNNTADIWTKVRGFSRVAQLPNPDIFIPNRLNTQRDVIGGTLPSSNTFSGTQTVNGMLLPYYKSSNGDTLQFSNLLQASTGTILFKFAYNPQNWGNSDNLRTLIKATGNGNGFELQLLDTTNNDAIFYGGASSVRFKNTETNMDGTAASVFRFKMNYYENAVAIRWNGTQVVINFYGRQYVLSNGLTSTGTLNLLLGGNNYESCDGCIYDIAIYNSYLQDVYVEDFQIFHDSFANIKESVSSVPNVSSTAVAVTSTTSIATKGLGVSRVAPAAAVTGMYLQPGVYSGQEVWVVNEAASANSVTFNASGSNVADGSSDVINGGTARKFVWDAATALWYRAS